MKRFSRLFVLCLFSITLMFVFSACKNGDDKSSPNDDGGNSVVTSQQILEYVADELEEKLNVGDGCFASKTGDAYNYSQYDENVYLGLNLLKEVSKISGVEDSKWYNSQRVEAQSGKVDKISALKLTSATQEEVVSLNLIVKFSIKGLDAAIKTKSFNLYNYAITYNKTTKDFAIDAVYEKSRDIEDLMFGDYSTSKCFKFSYSNELLITTEFKRNIDIDDLDNRLLINDSSISEYNFLKFNLSSNSVVTEIDGFDVENALKASVISSVQEILITLNNVNLVTFDVDAQEIQVSSLVMSASDAENISQLAQ